MLAVTVDYESRQATIGTKTGEPVPRKEILESLDAIGYTGKFVDD